jgi:hypothetical protein
MADAPSFQFSNFLSNDALEEIASAVKASPKGKLVLNILYLMAGNGHYRGASAIADAAKIVDEELHARNLLSEKEELAPKLVYLPDIIDKFHSGIIEWAARDLYESLSRLLFFQYSWNETSRSIAANPKLDPLYDITRRIVQGAKLTKKLDGVVLSAHFVPADVFAKYPEYSNRLAVIPLDDNVYPHFVRKETQNYFVGSKRCREDVVRSLAAYGISAEDAARRVTVTGQPVSPRSIKGASWNPADWEFWDEGKRPPRYLIAMGGAGAQLPQMEALLSSYTKYKARRPEVVFYVGHHTDAGAHLEKLGGPEGTRVVKFPNRLEAIESLHHEIRKADALITKPSELSFYPLPLYSLPPIGFHEELNLSAAILERRGRPMSSLWSLPLDPLEELASTEEDLLRMQKRALYENPNLSGAFQMVYRACKMAPASPSGQS